MTGETYTRQVDKDQLMQITADEQRIFVDNEFEKFKTILKQLNEKCQI
jgi:hypothetical protein